MRETSLHRRRTSRIFASMSGPTPRRREQQELISDDVSTEHDLSDLFNVDTVVVVVGTDKNIIDKTLKCPFFNEKSSINDVTPLGE